MTLDVAAIFAQLELLRAESPSGARPGLRRRLFRMRRAGTRVYAIRMSSTPKSPESNDERDQVKAIFAAQQAARAAEEAARQAAEANARPSDTPPPAGGASNGSKRRFPNIGPRAYEYPADAAAMAALRKLPGFDQLLRRFMGVIGERRIRFLYLASAVRVNEHQFKDLHRTYLECCEILDFKKIPELYVAQSPIVNAGAVGLDKPFIVLNSATLELYPPDEIPYVIGHELGHILSEHVLYKTMLRILLQIGLGRIGLPGLALFAVVAALKEWDRKSELSADRAGLLCVQDPETAYRILMKMAGGTQTQQMDHREFEKQAEEYERGGDVRDSALKLLNLLWVSHPFPVLRLAELKRYVERGDYDKILRGEYSHRSDLDTVRLYDEWAAGAESYKARMSESDDPLVNFVRDLGSSVGDVGASVWGQVKGAFGKKKGDDTDG